MLWRWLDAIEAAVTALASNKLSPRRLLLEFIDGLQLRHGSLPFRFGLQTDGRVLAQGCGAKLPRWRADSLEGTTQFARCKSRLLLVRFVRAEGRPSDSPIENQQFGLIHKRKKRVAMSSPRTPHSNRRALFAAQIFSPTGTQARESAATSMAIRIDTHPTAWQSMVICSPMMDSRSCGSTLQVGGTGHCFMRRVGRNECEKYCDFRLVRETFSPDWGAPLIDNKAALLGYDQRGRHRSSSSFN
jgi:hypothetical protein